MVKPVNCDTLLICNVIPKEKTKTLYEKKSICWKTLLKTEWNSERDPSNPEGCRKTEMSNGKHEINNKVADSPNILRIY